MSFMEANEIKWLNAFNNKEYKPHNEYSCEAYVRMIAVIALYNMRKHNMKYTQIEKWHNYS